MNLDGKYPIPVRWRAVAEHENGTLVCLAGPGTGKTWSLLRRVESLLESKGVNADNVYYITFIRAIAEAFTDDLQSYYTEQGKTAPPIWASTLHSVACRLIRNRGHLVGVTGEQHFLNLAERENWVANAVLADLMVLLEGSSERTLPQLRRSFNTLKASWRAGNATASGTAPGASLQDAYLRLSRAYRVVDWDEVVPLAIRILDSMPALPGWLQRYKHLLIDEYQDFNLAEQLFLGRLVSRAESAVIVGDDDQSLYSGRGADPSGIRKAWVDPEVDQVSLLLCRRCPRAIAEAANRFLQRVKQDPRLLVPVREGGTVAIRRFKSAKAEAQYLATYLRACLATLGASTDPKEGVACLFPSRDVLRQYERVLRDTGVPCQTRGTSTSHEAEEWLRVMLRLAAQPGQPFMQRLLLEMFGDIKPRHKRLVTMTVTGSQVGTVEAVRTLIDQGNWAGPAAEQAHRYLCLVGNLESREPHRIAAEMTLALPDRHTCDVPTIDRFLELALADSLEDAIDATIAKLLGPASDEPSLPRVELLTMHGSKGLTREHVVLPGLEHCWLPGEESGERLEELQRLFYVAITRSREDVLITYPRTRARGDSLNYPLPRRGRLSDFATWLGLAMN